MSRRQLHAFLVGVVLSMLVGHLRVAAAPGERDFEEDPWSNELVGVRLSDLRNSHLVAEGFTGSGLEVRIPSGAFRGVGSYDRLPAVSDQAWYRYHIQLLEFDSASTGKLPGLSGLYAHTARGCSPSTPSAPGWSARGMFGAAGTFGAPAGEVPIGFYIYHLDQPGRCGEALFWENSSLQAGRWHCIEGHVRLNSPGETDGAVVGWLDGTQRFLRQDLAFRRQNEGGIGIKELWLDIYFGGRRPTPNSLRVLIDQVAVSAEGRVGCLDAATDLVGSFGEEGRKSIATYDPGSGEWKLSRSQEAGFFTETWATFATKQEWGAHLVGDFTGDGKDEIASFHPSNGTWWVSSARDTGFETARWGTFSTASGWGTRLVGDFDGDGRDQIASYHAANGSWWVSSLPVPESLSARPWYHLPVTSIEWWQTELASQGVRPVPLPPPTVTPAPQFTTTLWEVHTTRTGWASQLAGDFNGDGRDDVASYHPGTGTWWVSLSSGDRFVTRKWDTFTTGPGWGSQLVGDFNGDGREDVASFHPGTGTWWVSVSAGDHFLTTLWDTFDTRTGWTNQVVGDFNGDGLDDIANYHIIAGGRWVSVSTGAGFVTTNWTGGA